MESEKVWFVVLIAVVLFLLGSLSGNLTGNCQENQETGDSTTLISISGEASLTSEPDQAVLYLDITSLADDASTSQSQAAEIYTDVKAALLLNGIKEEDIKTSYYYVGLKEDWVWDGYEYESVTLGYETIHELEVTTYDTEEVGALLDAVVDAGATVSYVSFELSEEKRTELEDQLIDDAVKDAQEKAGQIASSSGMTLGKLSSASYSSSGYYYPKYYSDQVSAMYSESAETSLSPGEIDVSISVSAVFWAN